MIDGHQCSRGFPRHSKISTAQFHRATDRRRINNGRVIHDGSATADGLSTTVLAANRSSIANVTLYHCVRNRMHMVGHPAPERK